MLLKQKYDQAKSVGQAVNDSKQRITELKSIIEQRRVQRAMTAQEGEDPDEVDDPEEGRCRDLIEQEKRRYKDSFNGLRDLKKEIERLHLLLEQSRMRLQKDFDQWMTLMTRQAAQHQASGSAAMSPAASLPMPTSPSPQLARYEMRQWV